MKELRFVALYKEGKPVDRHLFPELVFAVLAWENRPECEVVELNPRGKVIKTFSAEECRQSYHITPSSG